MKQHQNFKKSAILRNVFNLLLLELDVKIFYLKLQKYNNSEILMLLQKYIEIIMRGVHSNNIYLSSKLLKADCYTLKKRSCIRYTYKQTLITYLHYIRLIDKAPHRNPSLNVAQHSMYFLLLYSYICIRYSYSTHLISMNLNICCLCSAQPTTYLIL